MKLTRRDFASVLAPATALAGAAAAQQAPSSGPSAPAAHDPLLEAARARNRAGGALLADQAIPVDTAPAFQFKA
jgi:hypothetical protein